MINRVLDGWLSDVAASLTHLGDGVKSEMRPKSVPVSWNTGKLPVAHGRVNKFFGEMGPMSGQILAPIRPSVFDLHACLSLMHSTRTCLKLVR